MQRPRQMWLLWFCKQKTAYERRISDWSSDVCSSDLIQRLQDRETGRVIAANKAAILTPVASAWMGNPKGDVTVVEYFDYNCGFCRASLPTIAALVRSEEHTSELQSLMRISYAVFCLKKKNNPATHTVLIAHNDQYRRNH